jgi:chaperonin GroEL
MSGSNPVDIKSGINKAVACVVEKIKSISKKVDNDQREIEQVGTISANNDPEIGKMIAEAMKKVGKDGVITAEEAKGTQTEVKVVEGLEFDRGYLSPYFATNTEKMTVELDNPYILICDKKISALKDILSLLEATAQSGRPLFIIAEDVDGEALRTLVVNKIGGVLKVAAVKAPGFGDRRKDMLEDIAIVTGGTVISDERGLSLENAKLSDLGHAEKVKITKDSSVIVNGKGVKEKIEARVAQLRALIENSTSDYDKEKLQERLAKISGGVAVMYIGASTEVEMKEKKDRVDDALHATRAAIQEGVVPGGGVALLRSIEDLDKLMEDKNLNKDQIAGIKIVKQSLFEPIKTILSNAGEDFSDVIINTILNNSDVDYGYNAKTKRYEKFFDSGVLDPAKVTRLAIENASSVASLLLTTDCVIYRVPEEKSDKSCRNAGMDAGMGMM